jgi:hypothetical protein
MQLKRLGKKPFKASSIRIAKNIKKKKENVIIEQI